MSEDAHTGEPGDIKAFEAIVSEYESVLLRYAGRLLYNHDAAQDVVQEAFIRFYRSWEKKFETSAEVSSWLYRVTHNCAVDYLRREIRRQKLHFRHAEEKDEVTDTPQRHIGEVSEEAEKASLALRKLSVREQQLVILKVYEEKSYKEIGEITGLSTGNVGYILHNAMKKMANELKGQKNDE